MTSLLQLVRDHAARHADEDGLGTTPIPGLATRSAAVPSGIRHAVSNPLVCLVVQGAKEVTAGAETLSFAAGDSLLISSHVPIASRITHASREMPYLSLVVELNLSTVAELAAEMAAPGGPSGPVAVEPTDAEVAEAAMRLMRLVSRPEAANVLHASMSRELHYWLLAGRHGPAIRRLGLPDGHAARIARAVALLRADYARPLRVERLAGAAGMSSSSFHGHFRAATSLSPLQYQKQLRLIEARRLMVAEGRSASAAAFAVGYESVPQFTREYGRMFGAPPLRDASSMRRELAAA